jgi:excinuclease ABC subunit A
VLTGVSGSGKSTLAFDIVFNEGQRRYLESLNAYARQFVQPAARPDVDAIFGIPPTVAIEQRTSRGGRKSTVATLTEVYHFLRLLYVKLGTQHCPDCDVPIEPQSPSHRRAAAARASRQRSVEVLAPLVVARKGYLHRPRQVGARARPRRVARRRRAAPTGALAAARPLQGAHIELPVAALGGGRAGSRGGAARALDSALELGKGIVHIVDRASTRVFSTRRACPSCGTQLRRARPAAVFLQLQAWLVRVSATAPASRSRVSTPNRAARRPVELEWRSGDAACGACHGQRLNPVALGVRFRDRSIASSRREPVERIRGLLRAS